MTNRYLGVLPENLPRVCVIRGSAALHEEPSESATVETQVLYGETLAVHGRVGDWYDASLEFNDFCHRGYVSASVVADFGLEPTHRVWQPWTPLRSIPRLKAITLERLSVGSLMRVVGEAEDHYKVWPHGWVFKKHVREVSHIEPDFVSTIAGFAGTPFVWGGRSIFGLDCSGMIQLGLSLAGISSPRAMTDMLEHLGVPVTSSPNAAGDFIFYSEHCGMFVDATHVINSNGKAGRVQVEPLDELHQRMVDVRGYAYAGTRRL